MSDPIPPAPNPMPDPVPTPLPSIQGYIRPWEFVQIVLGTIAGGTIGWQMAIPLIEQLASSSDKWLVNPQYQEDAKLVLGALAAVLTSIFAVKKYFNAGDPPAKLLRSQAELSKSEARQ